MLEKKIPQYLQPFELCDDAVIGTDASLRIVFWNSAAELLLGMVASEATGRLLFEVVRPEQSDIEQEIHKRFETEDSYNEEIVCAVSSESRIWIDLHVKKLKIPQEESGGFLTVLKNVTPHKTYEQALKDSESRYRALFQAMSSGVAIYQPIDQGRDFLISEFNNAAERLTQTKRQDVLGELVSHVFPGVKAFGLFEVFQRVWRTGEAEHFPTKLYQDDRLSSWYDNYVYKIDSGEIVAIFDDHTERKRSEFALQEIQRKHKIISESARDAIVIMDGAGQIAYWSKAGERILGYSEQEILGTPSIEILTPGRLLESYQEEFLSFRSTGQSALIGKTIELNLKHKDGSEVPVELSLSAAEIDQQWHAICVMRDIRDRKQAEREKSKLEEQLRQAQKMDAVGRLAGGVAHDFNNVLTGIIGYSEVIQRSLSTVDPLSQHVAEIRKAAEKAAELTHQLLAFSRKQIIEPRVIQPNEILSNSKKMLARIIGEDISLDFLPSDDLWRIRADPTQIDQIMVNLIVNARDAMPNGGTVNIETSNTTLDATSTEFDLVNREPRDYVMISVTDTGCGMDKDILQYIFEPFFTTKEDSRGTGLGLAIVYGIVQQNEGLVSVYSEKGLGTTFRIYLPAVKEEVETDVEVAPSELPIGHETVMLVEDEEMVRRLSASMLEEQGYQVIVAENGAEAIVLAEKYMGDIHLLLTDVVMPIVNGSELFERIKETRPGIKALFMSGYTQEVVARRGVLERGIRFIQKPFTLEALAKKVRKALDDIE